jgi:surface antigen
VVFVFILCYSYSENKVHYFLGVTRMKKLISFLSISIVLTGCVTTGGPNQTAGTILGGVGGAFLGSRFGHGKGKLATTALGTFAGSMIGGYMGQGMDNGPSPQQQNAYPPEYAYATPYDYAPQYYHPPQRSHPHHPPKRGRSHQRQTHHRPERPAPYHYEYYEEGGTYY